MINIFREPMTAQDIVAARMTVADGHRLADSIAFRVFLFCPAPSLDVVAAGGVAKHFVESAFIGDPDADLRDVPGAVSKDWRDHVVAEQYVQKVRGQGRELIRAEVETLEWHRALWASYVPDEATHIFGRFRAQIRNGRTKGPAPGSS